MRYLRYLGHDRLATMGYEADQLIGELSEQETAMRSLMPDLGRLLLDVARSLPGADASLELRPADGPRRVVQA